MAIAHQLFLESDKCVPERADTSPIFSGAKEVLRVLSDRGLKLGILSADSTSGVEAFIKKHQLCDYIQLAMGVDSQLTKPNPELFRRACTALGIPPEATLMVGDSPGDIAMAKSAGAAGAIAITQHYHDQEHLNQADIIINNLQELAILA
jgi:phosphoglycolate phosphatase